MESEKPETNVVPIIVLALGRLKLRVQELLAYEVEHTTEAQKAAIHRDVGRIICEEEKLSYSQEVDLIASLGLDLPTQAFLRNCVEDFLRSKPK